MELNDNHEEDHITHPNLDAVSAGNPFLTPTGYFEDFNDRICAEIFTLNILSNAGEGGFTTPEGYFDSLSDHIHNHIKAESWTSEGDKNPFETPDKYFNTATEEILDKTVRRETLKEATVIRSLKPRVFQYLSAACILIIGAFMLLRPSEKPSLDQKLSALPEEAIVNYLISRGDTGDIPAILANTDTRISTIEPNTRPSEKEIRDYLDITAL